MQIYAKSLINKPVVSLFSSKSIAKVVQIVVNADQLKILLFKVEDNGGKAGYLLSTDLRDIDNKQLIIDSGHNISPKEDLIRHQEAINKPCTLWNFRITTASGRRLGKCENYLFDPTSLNITKIYLATSFWRQVLTAQHVIDASDVVRIQNKTIIVKDGLAYDQKPSKTKALPQHSA